MPRRSELTTEQANDLTRYFLGPDWHAERPSDQSPCFLIYHSPLSIGGLGTSRSYRGPTWRAAFRAAGFKPPSRPQFVAQKERVMMKDKCVAVACSATFAARTANALNEYDPDSRGL